MKKLLVLLPLVLLAAACGPTPKEPLPPTPEQSYSSKLTPEKTTITTDDSTEATRAVVASEEDESVTYEFELSADIYLNTKSSVANQFGVKPGASIKSVSTYTVDRIIVDFYGSKGVNYDVFANAEGTGTKLESHESTIAPADPNDGGQVLEYAINGTAWCLKNNTEFNKPSFYSITVIYSK